LQKTPIIFRSLLIVVCCYHFTTVSCTVQQYHFTATVSFHCNSYHYTTVESAVHLLQRCNTLQHAATRCNTLQHTVLLLSFHKSQRYTFICSTLSREQTAEKIYLIIQHEFYVREPSRQTSCALGVNSQFPAHARTPPYSTRQRRTMQCKQMTTNSPDERQLPEDNKAPVFFFER